MTSGETPQTTFYLPDLGEGLQEAEIVSWHVEVGATVAADQPLVTVETDKAVVDIPAPFAGRIIQLHAQPGAHVRVGAPLATLQGSGSAREQPVNSIVGELPSGALTGRDDRPAASGRVRASPRARRQARVLGVDLANVAGSGPDGVIEQRDIAAGASDSGGLLQGVRRAMAQRMAQADARVVRASLTGEADISCWPPDTRIILRLIRAIGLACQVQPLLNARFDDDRAQLALQEQVNLGIAMETVDGLFVPVLTDVTARQPADLERELAALKAGVTDRSIDAAALRGQTITLSNFGAFGGLFAEMVVVPPQVAIVGAGRAFQRLVMEDERPVEHRFLPLTITFDHRVITGAETGSFLRALIEDLERFD